MAKTTIGVGTTANDGTGDQLRDAFITTNENIAEIYGTGDDITEIISIAAMNGGLGTPVRVTKPLTLAGVDGDTAGMIAFDAATESVYVCIVTWTDGIADIWIQLNTDATVDHNAILNIGSNDHTAIDAHIAAGSMHYLQSAISITESQISDIDTAINDQIADYELVLGDARAMVRMNLTGTANTLTIPANSAVAFPIGTVIEINMVGTGVTTIAITTDTLNYAGTINVMAQWEVVKLTKVSATEWLAA